MLRLPGDAATTSYCALPVLKKRQSGSQSCRVAACHFESNVFFLGRFHRNVTILTVKFAQF